MPGLYDEHDHIKAAAEQRWMVYDVDFKTGKIRWAARAAHRRMPPLLRHIKNSYASETPVTDGERVYVYFGSIGLRRRAGLQRQDRLDQGARRVQHAGRAGHRRLAGPLQGSPLHRQRQHDAVVPRRVRQAGPARRSGASTATRRGNWSTPFVWENELRTEIVTTGTRKVRSYDLDGKLLWELAGMSTLTIPVAVRRSTACVYISSGYPGGALRPVYAIRPGASGDISLKPDETSNEYIAWYQPLLGTYNTSALVYGDYYYTLLDRGFLLCHDARTGKQIYGRQRISVDASGFTASPWAYNGKIFVLSEDGDTFVDAGRPEFKVLGKNSLDRDAAGHARRAARQPDHPDAVERCIASRRRRSR